jgi:hypothetical protein
MSSGTFVLALAIGAGLLAIWTHARFPGLAPERLGRTMLHTAASVLLLHLLPAVIDSGLSIQIALLGIVLPALTYAMLAAIWMLRLAQTTLGLQR